MISQVVSGDRRALAQTISRVEEGGPDAQALLAALYGRTGRAHIVGITGAPGSGKSTLANALALSYRAAGLTVGIVAVDPTSPFSGGALLGDRVRMRDLSGDPGVFIRSMATRGSLGGLARATADVILVLEAAGYDRILVETVGVGQAEVDIAGLAHTTIVVVTPGLGDEVQAIKAGILEIADLFAVNKADRDGADRVVVALQMMQGLATDVGAGHHWPPGPGLDQAGPGPGPGRVWRPPVVKTIAPRRDGVEVLRNWVERHASHLADTGQIAREEERRAAAALDQILSDRLRARLRERLPEGELENTIAAVARREIDPYSAAERLLEM